MDNILEMYKKHINPNPDGSEIHSIYANFGIGIEIYYPEQEPWLEENRQHRLHVANKRRACIEWILNNSKLNLEILK